MHPVARRLFNDHQHFELLLRCLEHRTVGNETPQQWSDDLPIIFNALDYISVYPERWHHPVEDKIFGYLAERHPMFSKHITSLALEHEDLEQLTLKLRALFKAFSDGEESNVRSLSPCLCEFLQRQSDHMEYENEHIYPLMESYLTDEDWRVLTRSIEAGEDPLFDDTLEEYEELFRQIMKAENTQFADR